MQSEWTNFRINEERFRSDFEALCAIGKTGKTGVNRPALSPEHLAARDWLRKSFAQSGLKIHQDGAGNLSAYLGCGPADAPSLLMGSHIDSVPNGGRFDGALGVLAGLEVLRTVQEAGIRLPVNLEVVDFTDEEGTLVSFLGSFAFSGLLSPENLANPRGGRQKLLEGLKRANLSEKGIFSARRDPKTVAGYLELHVEQGPRLFQSGIPVGIVTHISGIAFYRLTFLGRAEHAGTASMTERLDAAQGASAFTLSVRELIIEKFPECFANVGNVCYVPGAFNIVPEKAVLSLEFRAADSEQFERLKSAMLERAEQDARCFGLGLEIEFLGKRDPVETHPKIQAVIREAAEQLGLNQLPLVSRAGHDAQSLAAICPVGMIFIPSVNGISHSPDEFTPWQDCVNGANVLLQVVLSLASQLS